MYPAQKKKGLCTSNDLNLELESFPHILRIVLLSWNYLSSLRLVGIKKARKTDEAAQMFDSKFHSVNKSRRGRWLRYNASPTDRIVRDLRQSGAFSLQLFPKRGEKPLCSLCIWFLYNLSEENECFKALGKNWYPTSLQHVISLSMSFVCPFCASSMSILSCRIYTFEKRKRKVKNRKWVAQ